MSLVVHGIQNCDTVKRARAWLAGRGVAHEFHDFKTAGLPPTLLDAWIAQVGWERLVNRQGLTWKKLDEATRAGVVDAASARALMLASPSLVKRPVVAWPGGELTVGFDEARWGAMLA
ncbi:MAG: ArsC family reductase [Rubrivivax sp.]|nr:ArsC family reductase [Rubrivivax sp.]